MKTLRSRPDLAIGVALTGFFVGCSLMYLPGHAAFLAWHNINNPIFYAIRFASPELFPNDLLASYQRDVVPLATVVYLFPALMLKYLHVPPWYVTFVEMASNDLLIVLAIYWLSRGLGLERAESVFAGVFTVASRVLSWNLAGYDYQGHDFPYTGSLFIPFAVAVVASLLHERVGLALVCTAIAVLVFAPTGVVMLGVVLLFLVLQQRTDLWRAAGPWLVAPLLALAWAAAMQVVTIASIKEPLSYADDLKVVMVNGHFVPLWIRGHFGGVYLGFFMWSALGVLAARSRWQALSNRQRAPMLALAVVVAGLIGVGLLAVQQGWLWVLRFGPFRYTVLLGVVWVPIVVRYLVDKIGGGDTSTRVVALLLVVLLSVDRATAWMLPLMLPCVAFLAAEELLSLPRWLKSVAATIGVCAALDVLLPIGAGQRIAEAVDPSKRVVALLGEMSHRLQDGGGELLLLPLIGVPTIWIARRNLRAVEGRERGSALVMGLCAFLFACMAIRSATVAAWSATGPPRKFEEAALWARASTPIAAKFIFFDVERDGHYPSWQTLSERGSAELQYSWQKVYSSDRRLLRIDERVTALYGFDPATVGTNPYPFFAPELYEKYQHFTVEDFLRVARLSGSNFAVLKKPQAVGFPVAFENELFVAYRVPATFGDVIVSATKITDRSITVSWSGAGRPRADRQLIVEFRDARSGMSAATDCCATIDASAGDHTFNLPSGLKGRYLALVGVVDVATGRRLSLEGDASGENLAFWSSLAAH